jgi:predicted dehydrogenase
MAVVNASPGSTLDVVPMVDFSDALDWAFMTNQQQYACRVAIVGAGYMARERSPFQSCAGVEGVGLHSRTRARAEALAAEFHVPGVYDTIQAMAEGTRADLVVVTTPELETNAVCRATFAFPWTVLIEKPAGYDLADAEDIEAVARAANRRAYVALNRRFYGSTRTVATDLATQDGQRLIVVRDQEDPRAALAAGQPALVVKNWMYANSVHMIDFFRVFGRGTVTGVDRVIPWNADAPGFVAARVSFSSGDIGLYEAIWMARVPGR